MGPRPKLAEINRERSRLFREANAGKTVRTCTRCKVEKPIGAFGSSKKTWDGRGTWCADCMREYNRLEMRRLVKELRSYCLQKLGGQCLRCGFSDARALQIDHVNGGGSKESRTTRLGTPRYYRKVFAAVAGIYQLLCANCNWIKRHERGETPPRSYQ